MDSEDLAEVPEGTLEVTGNMLRKKILSSPSSAWEMLKQNPVAVVALNRVRRELLSTHAENENVVTFFEEYDATVESLFNLDEFIETNGLAMATELLTEIWRRNQQDPGLKSQNKQLLDSLELMNKEVEVLENTSSNRVIREMVDYALKRIIDFEEYEKMKAKKHWQHLAPAFEELISEHFSTKTDDEIPPLWRSWFALGTSTVLAAEIYRNEIARIIFQNLSEQFHNLSEEVKYQVAPWIIAFEKVLEEFDSQQA